jgi:hypothetical protein
MNTKILMAASAVIMGTIAIIFTFLPQEVIIFTGHSVVYLNVLLIQILGALYFAFAALNWMAKANLIGGIYSKPVAIANFTHFFIGGITLLKNALTQEEATGLWIAAIIYSLFAILFAKVTFGNPLKK